jgi:hypothetical protein
MASDPRISPLGADISPLTCLKASGYTVNQCSSGRDANELQERGVWLVEPSNYMEIYSLLAQMGFYLTGFQFFKGEKHSKINSKGNYM